MIQMRRLARLRIGFCLIFPKIEQAWRKVKARSAWQAKTISGVPSTAVLVHRVDTGRIADANPAAGALLGVARDGLLECDAEGFVAPACRGAWSTHLAAVSEGAAPRRLRPELQDAGGLAP